MIPMLARIRIRSGRSRLGLWAPLFLVWLLLLPLAILFAPFTIVVLAIRGAPPLRTMRAALCMLGSLAGTEICVETRASDVLIRLI